MMISDQSLNQYAGKPNAKRFFAFIILMVLAMGASAQSSTPGQPFYHDETNFPLDFVHSRVSCDSCHIQAVFIGTPTRCASCHTHSGLIRATAPSPTHIRTTEDCEFCHQAGGWESVGKVDHFAVVGTCQSCHNGVIATGKNQGHIQSSDNCDDCHRTFTWLGAVFDHSDIMGNCQSCHNGVTADGKNPTHILTTDNCDDCHRTVSWTPVLRVDHVAVLGSCSSCHNGVTATGKDVNHFITTLECDNCHNTLNWITLEFRHQSISYPGDHAQQLPCTACHAINSQIVTWSSPAYQPDCAGCHEGDYRADKHEEDGGGFYTVSELRDCSGACHEPAGEHRVSANSWDN